MRPFSISIITGSIAFCHLPLVFLSIEHPLSFNRRGPIAVGRASWKKICYHFPFCAACGCIRCSQLFLFYTVIQRRKKRGKRKRKQFKTCHEILELAAPPFSRGKKRRPGERQKIKKKRQKTARVENQQEERKKPGEHAKFPHEL